MHTGAHTILSRVSTARTALPTPLWPSAGSAVARKHRPSHVVSALPPRCGKLRTACRARHGLPGPGLAGRGSRVRWGETGSGPALRRTGFGPAPPRLPRLAPCDGREGARVCMSERASVRDSDRWIHIFVRQCQWAWAWAGPGRRRRRHGWGRRGPASPAQPASPAPHTHPPIPQTPARSVLARRVLYACLRAPIEQCTLECVQGGREECVCGGGRGRQRAEVECARLGGGRCEGSVVVAAAEGRTASRRDTGTLRPVAQGGTRTMETSSVSGCTVSPT